jgi:hypothetical protein
VQRCRSGRRDRLAQTRRRGVDRGDDVGIGLGGWRRDVHCRGSLPQPARACGVELGLRREQPLGEAHLCRAPALELVLQQHDLGSRAIRIRHRIGTHAPRTLGRGPDGGASPNCT